jgi:hypothetical protein
MGGTSSGPYLGGAKILNISSEKKVTIAYIISIRIIMIMISMSKSSGRGGVLSKSKFFGKTIHCLDRFSSKNNRAKA